MEQVCDLLCDKCCMQDLRKKHDLTCFKNTYNINSPKTMLGLLRT